jgi:hypothetical protein
MRATRDLDAVFIPTDVVRRAAAAVAEREGLAEDWLNDAVKGFLPGPDPDAQRFYSSDSLIVDVASPRYLLAMKLFAARAEIDADDSSVSAFDQTASNGGRTSSPGHASSVALVGAPHSYSCRCVSVPRTLRTPWLPVVSCSTGSPAMLTFSSC